MKGTRMLLTGAVLAVFTAWFAVSAPAMSSRGAGAPAAHVQQLQLTIVGGGSTEVVGPSLGNIAIAAGVPVRMTVTNYGREYHTFTIPGLGVSALILPARGNTPTKTTFTFTASKQGIFKWYCAFCAMGMHEKPHSMGGTVYAVINPAALA
jgi:plastocyanin